jgi:hypothetical protein
MIKFLYREDLEPKVPGLVYCTTPTFVLLGKRYETRVYRFPAGDARDVFESLQHRVEMGNVVIFDLDKERRLNPDGCIKSGPDDDIVTHFAVRIADLR